MRKLGACIRYECTTSFKYIWIFYGACYGVMALITLLVAFFTGEMSTISSAEFNTMVYVGILGALGFHEDFKMLIQNGFTRTYIFLANFAMFVFISGVMALIDTLLSLVLRWSPVSYRSLFQMAYGENQSLLMNWLFLLLVYTTVCSLTYLIVLIINRIGGIFTLIGAIALAGAAGLLLPALFRHTAPGSLSTRLLSLLGLLADGSRQPGNAIGLFLALTVLFGGLAYLLLRRAELKTL